MVNYERWSIIAYRTLMVLGMFLTLYVCYDGYKLVHSELKSIKEDVELLNHQVDSMAAEIDTLKSIHPWKEVKAKKTSYLCKEGMFFGFLLYTPVDTSICPQFRMALADYTGPTVKVNSLRRYGTKSEHCKGRAVDLELTQELVFYLTSDAGKQWLETHNLSFMIEGKPGSRRVKKYVGGYSQFVFFNPKATGDHVHIEKV